MDCALGHTTDLVDCLRMYRLMDENPPEAVKLAKGVLAQDPESVQAHLLLAQLELDQSDREAAKAKAT